MFSYLPSFNYFQRIKCKIAPSLNRFVRKKIYNGYITVLRLLAWWNRIFLQLPLDTSFVRILCSQYCVTAPDPKDQNLGPDSFRETRYHSRMQVAFIKQNWMWPNQDTMSTNLNCKLPTLDRTEKRGYETFVQW